MRLTPKGTPERGRLKNGRFWNGFRPLLKIENDLSILPVSGLRYDLESPRQPPIELLHQRKLARSLVG